MIRANREDFRRDSWRPPVDVGGPQSAPHHLHNHLIIKTPHPPHRHHNTNTQSIDTQIYKYKWIHVRGCQSAPHQILIQRQNQSEDEIYQHIITNQQGQTPHCIKGISLNQC